MEAIATLWAFNQAVQAGALYGDVECNGDGLLRMFNTSGVVQEQCDEITNGTSELEDGLDFKVGCLEGLTGPPTGKDSFEAQCLCDGHDDVTVGGQCFWSPVTYTS